MLQNAVMGRGVLILAMLLFSACTTATSDKEPEPAEELGKSFIYGNGLGTAALNVGTTIVFPPYGLYVLGNTIISASGYEGFYVSNMLPDEDKKEFNSFYDTVTSGPGRFTAAVAGEEFRNRERVKSDIERVKEQLRGGATYPPKE